MEKRAQFSILFEDDELYDNFIVYQKSQKTLRPLVLKLLTAYYYNDEVRELVDNNGQRYEEGVQNPNAEMMDYFRQCQESLAMMSVYADGLEDLTEDSIEKFSEFTDNLAQRTGGTTSKETDFGKTTAQLSLGNVSMPNENQVGNIPMSAGSENARLDMIENNLTYLTSLVQSLVQQGGIEGVKVPPVQPTQTVQQNFDSSSSESQDLTTSNEVGAENTAVEEPVEIEEEPVGFEGESVEEVKESVSDISTEDASQVFDDLLSDVVF